MNVKKLWFVFVAVIFFTVDIYAYKECTYSIEKIWQGPSGKVIFYSVGGDKAEITGDTTPSYLSMLMASILANKKVTVRYEDANNDKICNDDPVRRTDVLGIYLLN